MPGAASWKASEICWPVCGPGSPIPQDSGHGDLMLLGSGPVFDGVFEDQVGAGVVGSGVGEVLA